MILKKIAEIDSINQFLIKGVEVIWTGHKVLLNSKLISEDDIKLIRLYDDQIYIQKSNLSELIDLGTLDKRTLPHVGDIIHRDILLFGKYNETYTKRKVFAISYQTKKEIWSREEGIGKIYWKRDQLFGAFNSSLYKHDFKTGNMIWELDLTVLGKYTINGELKEMDLQDYIGILNDIIYLKAGTSIILGVNINTGQIEYSSEYKKDYLVLDNLRLDKKTNKIFSIGPRHYIEFDLLSCNYELTDIESQTIKHSIQTSRLGGWNKDSIYFWEGSINTKFGEFSRSQKEIKWVNSIEEVTGKFPAIKDIQFGQGKLYINDYNNRLHIYKINEYAT